MFTRFLAGFKHVIATDTFKTDGVSMCIDIQVNHSGRLSVVMHDTIENTKTYNTGHKIFHNPKNKDEEM